MPIPAPPAIRPAEHASEPRTSVAAATERRRWWVDPALFAAIALAAFGIRYLYMLQARACPLFDALIMDGRQYYNWATSIVGGEWLGTQVFYQAPLYPYFLAVARLAVGDDLWPIRLIQISLGALSCGLLFLAGRTMFSRGAGVLAGCMLAFYPPAIFYDTLIQKAGLGLLWMTLLLWLLARAARRPSSPRLLLVGVSLGLLMLTREETILLVPVLAGWIVLERWQSRADAGRSLHASILSTLRAAAPQLAAFVLGLGIILTPVALRNAAVGGEFILTTSQAGPNFYIGNNPDATGIYAPLRPGRSNTPYERQDAVELAELALGRALTAGEVSRYWIGESLAYIRTQPGSWLKLMGRKSLLLVNAYEVPDYEDQYFFERYSPLLLTMSGAWHFGILAPLAAFAMVLMLGAPRNSPAARHAWLLAAILATLCIAVVLFFIFGRYRFPIAPVLMLFASAGLWRVAIAIIPAARRAAGPCGVPHAGRLALAAVALCATGVLANWPLFHRDAQLAMAYSNAGSALADLGNDEQALAMLDEALRIDPHMPDTLSNKAMIIGRPPRNDLPQAITLLREASRLRPDDPRIQFRLGTAFAETGQLQLAATHLERAVRLGPLDLDARTNYAMVLLHLGLTAAGAEQLRIIVQQAPPPDGNLMAASLLAWILATSPDAALADPGRAVTLGEQLVAATGGTNPEMMDILAAALARAGRYNDAIATAARASEMAAQMGILDLAQEIQERLTIYRRQQPWIER